MNKIATLGRVCLVAIGAAAPLTSITSAWAADYGAMAEVRIVDSPTTDLQNGAQPVSALAANSGGGGTASTAAMASARVETGGIHLIATTGSSMMAGPATIYSSSEALGGFTDSFVFGSTQAPVGALIDLTVRFHVSGAIGTSSSGVNADGLGAGGAASWRGRFSLYGNDDGVNWEGYESESRGGGDATRDGNATPGDKLFSFSIHASETLYLSMSGRIEARSGAQIMAGASGSVTGSGSALFGNTLSWGGIVSAVDANSKQALTQYSALSADTGFDYAKAYVSAVPEPQSALLWLAGLGLLGGVLRRRR